MTLKEADIDIYNAIQKEKTRQQDKIELIASENYTSEAVLEAQGSMLTNKYAEGYPGHRYYGGCENVDIIENIAIERAKQLFGAEHANVQPHSGSQANMAVYEAFLALKSNVLGMGLQAGGHLTHGSLVNFSGKHYEFESYGLDDNGFINYDELRIKATLMYPTMIVVGASAYPRIIDYKTIREICNEVNAYMMVDMAHVAGLVAAGLHPSPVPYADFVTSTTHKTLRGPRGGLILCKKEYAKDIDKAIFPGIQGGPLEHVIAAKAVCFNEAMTQEFVEYQQQVLKNAKALAEYLIERGFNLITNGTSNHLMLVDLRNKEMTGKEAEERLDEVGITVNKNSVPNDSERPTITSGIRIGTPAVTTRGMKEDDMAIIARVIDMIVGRKDAMYPKYLVEKLCKKYPIY